MDQLASLSAKLYGLNYDRVTLEAMMASVAEEQGLWSVENLATRYQVSEATVHQWLYKGTAPRSLKIGRYRRFRAEDVLAWEDAQADREPVA